MNLSIDPKRALHACLAAACLVTLAVGLSTITGCTSRGTPQHARECETYQKLYIAYRLSAALRDPSEDEIKAATVATEYLREWCGWQQVESPAPPAGPDGTRSGPPPLPVDRWGVPVITPPSV